MYKKLTEKFKSSLADRTFEIKMNCITLFILVVCVVAIIISWVLYKSELLLVLLSVGFILIYVFGLYLLAFVTAKRKFGLRGKDFFKIKKVFNCLRGISEKDTVILKEILQEFRIDTRPKKQECIRHYQMLLQSKPQSGFSTLSVITIIVAIFETLFTCIQNGTMNAMAFTIFLACFIAITSIICFAIKWIYKKFIYCLTEYGVYERIESALSEIWMSK